MEVFIFDSSNNTVRINEPSILLVKEFKNLWDPSRNKCKEDSTGNKRLRAYKEFTYIYLFLDWKSPYFQRLEQEKHDDSLIDSGLTKDDLKDPLFIAALNKYSELQDSDRILALIKTAYKTLYKTQVFLDEIDFHNDIDENGKPLYKPADVIKDIGSIAKMRNHLIELEIEYKKNLKANSKVRGDNTPGYKDV